MPTLLKRHVVVFRPCAPCFSNDIGIQKNIRRKLERKWRSTRLPADRECYVIQKNMIASAKHDYNSSKIQENSGNARILFKTVEKLLNSNPAKRYPIGHDNLSESFVEFFTDKIVRIRNDLDSYSGILNDSPVTLCMQCCT